MKRYDRDTVEKILYLVKEEIEIARMKHQRMNELKELYHKIQSITGHNWSGQQMGEIHGKSNR